MPQDLTRLVLAAALAVVVPGCAAWGPGPERAAAERALASPEAVADRSFQRILTLRYGERTRRFLAAGHVCDGELLLSLLSPQGLEIVRLRHRRNGLDVVHERGLPRGLTPRSILADFQLIHWPARALRRAWVAPWALEVGPDYRQAMYRDRPRVRVHYAGEAWTAGVTLEDRARNYRLRVRPREHALGGCPGSSAGTAGAGEANA